MNKAVYHITDFAPHYYNVRILTQAPDHKWFYSGVGRFCTTWTEAVAFCKYYNCTVIEREEV